MTLIITSYYSYYNYLILFMIHFRGMPWEKNLLFIFSHPFLSSHSLPLYNSPLIFFCFSSVPPCLSKIEIGINLPSILPSFHFLSLSIMSQQQIFISSNLSQTISYFFTPQNSLTHTFGILFTILIYSHYPLYYFPSLLLLCSLSSNYSK